MKKLICLLTLIFFCWNAEAAQFALNSDDGEIYPVLGTASGGSVSDTVYGAGWNGDTTNAPSKNAVYDKIELISGGSAPGAVTYLSCADSIQTKITAATAGDTLVLGSCTYAPASAITIDKALTIKGSGVGQTIITPLEGLFTITADDVHLEDFTIFYSGTAVIGELISFDCSGTTVCNDESVTRVNSTVTTSGTAPGRIQFYDAGGVVSDVHFTNQFSLGTAGQVYGGIFKRSYSTAEADTVLRVYNSSFRSTNTNAAHSGQHRAVMNWNNGADESPASHYIYSYNSDYIVINSGASTTTDTEAMVHQGLRIYGYFYGGVVDGTTWSLPGVSTNPADLRCHDGGECNFYGTTFGRGLDEGDTGSGVTKIWGYMNTNGIIGDVPTQAPSSLNGLPAIQLTGAQGGDKPGTGTTVGLIGGGFPLTAGAGGAATEATVTGTAGAGGAFTLTAGAGGAQTAATTTTNVGGAGGKINLIPGVGGVGNSAATTNTGGAGGSVYLRGAAGGIGTTTNGADGHVILGMDSASTRVGSVGVGTLSPQGELDISVAASSTPANAGTLFISRDDTSLSANDIIGEINFWSNDTSLTTNKLFGVIDTYSFGTVTTDYARGVMRFKFQLQSGANPIEVINFSSSGVIINEQSQGSGTDLLVPLRVETDSDVNAIYVDGLTNSVQIGSATATAGKFIVAPPASQTIADTNTITANACGAIKQITSAGAVATNTTNTFTAPAAANTGCVMMVINVGANNITLDNNALFKSAGGADVVMTADDAVVVASNGTLWYQVSALEAN